LKVKLLESVEKAGAFEPIGSEMSVSKVTVFYLNEGMGNACAGHSKLKPDPRRVLNIEPLEAVAKVGAFDPTGSKRLF